MDLNIPELERSGDKLELLDAGVFTKYLDLLFQREYESVCSTRLVASNEYFVEVNISEGTYKISNYLLTLYEDCKVRDVRFFILPIYLIFPQVYDGTSESISQVTGHSNAVLIDTKMKLVEWFEPHGEMYKGHPFLIFDTKRIVWGILGKIFPGFEAFFTFRNALESCSYLAPQRGDRDTYCLGWSLLFIEMRLLNPLLTSEDIFRKFDRLIVGDDRKLRYIKRYIIHVEGKVREFISKLHSLYVKGISFSFDEIIINKGVLDKRIWELLELYKREGDMILRMGIFYELMGYSHYSRFHDILFMYMNKVGL